VERLPSSSICWRCNKVTSYPPVKIPIRILGRSPSGALNVLYQPYCISCARSEIGNILWRGPLAKRTKTYELGFSEFRKKEQKDGREEEADSTPE